MEIGRERLLAIHAIVLGLSVRVIDNKLTRDHLGLRPQVLAQIVGAEV